MIVACGYENNAAFNGRVAVLPIEDQNFYNILLDNGDRVWATFPELSRQLPIATRVFRVGDRVSYERIPGATNTPGTGEITRIADNGHISVRDSDHRTWSFIASELSHE